MLDRLICPAIAQEEESMAYQFHRLAQHDVPKTLVPQTGMTNPWLASQGLLSVRDLWIKVQGYS